MKRREFLKKCGYSAVCLGSASSALTACKSVNIRQISTKKNSQNELVVRKLEFTSLAYVLLSYPEENYSICLYKVSDEEYLASLMKCTHQKCTTEVLNNAYICPCHGAKFAINGEVLKGPAEKNLQTFKTRVDEGNIYVSIA